MKKRSITRVCLPGMLALAALAILALPAVAQAPGGTDRPGWRYDPATEMTVKGTIEAVTQREGRKGWAGTHLTLKTEKETLDVHLGPSWFLKKNKMTLAKGDEVEITGSRVKLAEKEAFLARILKKADQSLTLRNEQGIPAWSRGPRK